MKKQTHRFGKVKAQANPKSASPTGPNLYEIEYLNQIVEELKLFLQSRNATTVHDIYLGFQGGDYQGKMLLSKGA